MVRCAGKIANGERCSRNAVEGSMFCWQHQKTTQTKKQNPKKSPRQSSPRKMTKAEEETQRRYCRCLKKVHIKQPEINEYAICYKSVGRVTNSCKNYK